MPNIPPDALMAALGAVHQTGVKTDPNTGAPYDDTQQGGAPGGQDPNAAGGQGDPSEQAIWDAFPSTDPQQIDQLAQQAQQGGDPGQLEQLIQGFYQQVAQDRDDFEQRQQMNEERFWSTLGGGANVPDQSTAAPAEAAAPAPPGVGGGAVGY